MMLTQLQLVSNSDKYVIQECLMSKPLQTTPLGLLKKHHEVKDSYMVLHPNNKLLSDYNSQQLENVLLNKYHMF